MFENGIAIIGSSTIDENITPAGRWDKVGGATTYCGITFRRHGIATTIVSNIAPQDGQIQSTLYKEGLRICSGRTTQTTHFINEVTENKRQQKMPLRSAPIKSDAIAEIVERVGCIHLGPLHPEDIDPAVIETIRLAQLPVILDVQGYTRRIEGTNIAPGVSRRLSSALSISQIVKANAPELEAILSFLGLDASGLIKSYNIKEFIVTRGAKGGFVQDRAGSVHLYEAHRIDSVEDPTGAGDVFLAAYMVGRFLNKLSIEDACEYAAGLAARQVSGKYITNETLALRI